MRSGAAVFDTNEARGELIMIFWQGGTVFFFLELVTSITVMAKIGFFKTILLWLLGAFGGGFLIQAQGLAVLEKARSSFENGRIPMPSLFDSLCVFIAGLLFILPGFLSDIMGLALLLPPVRARLKTLGTTRYGLREEEIIEGEYSRIVEDPAVLNRPPRQN